MPSAAARDTAMAAASTVWAKSWPFTGPVEQWLPLWQHLDDTADVAGLLFDRWLSPAVRQLLTSSLGNDPGRARELVCWLAGVHDIGKATPAFAVQVPRLADRMRSAGLPIGPTVLADRSQLRHELAGAAIVDRWLADRYDLGRFVRPQLTGVVAGHHGAFPTATRLFAVPGMPALSGTGPWIAVQDALLDRAARRSGLDLSASEWRRLRLPQPTQMLLTGLVVMSDWIASGHTFPLFDVDDVREPPEIGPPVRTVTPRADLGVRDVHLPRPWVPHLEPDEPIARFADRFPWARTGPRPVQRAAVDLAASMLAPGLMMIEAPMGVGKTEAAFMVAEVLAARTGATGCFVALPTQATSNALFSRMLRWLDRVPDASGTGAQSVALVHGKAALNDDLRRLPLGVGAHAPIYDENTDGSARQGTARVHSVVGEWTRGRKQAAMSSFVVGTIDQVLFSALRARHTVLRHLSLAGKVVVIDEVHAADVYMSAFLDRALEWLAACGTPVVLMSATVPAARRIALYRAYERGRLRLLGQCLDDDPVRDAMIAQRLEGSLGYPSLVVSAADGPLVVSPPEDATSRHVHLRRLDDGLEALTDLLSEKLRDGGCAVVVRNTVRRAQETARRLTEVFGAESVTVAHAGFLAADRVAIDEGLLDWFGPPGPTTHRPERRIVVATQVVEQSLDIDFDLMVTDCAPVDLVLQRIGRLHRHERGAAQQERPEAVRTAECFVTGVDWRAAPPRPDRGAVAVYGAWLLLAGLATLEQHLDGAPIVLPADISTLVQAAYSDDLEVPDSWGEAVSAARRAFADDQARRAQLAELFAIAPVQAAGRDLYDSDLFSAGAVEEDSALGQGLVRDGTGSIEAVVVVRGADGTDRIPHWVHGGGGDLPLRPYPVPPEQARVLARCTVRLPYVLSVPGVADHAVRDLEQNWFEGWQRTPFLSGQLALVLDGDLSAQVAGHHVRYDLRLGLVVDGDAR